MGTLQEGDGAAGSSGRGQGRPLAMVLISALFESLEALMNELQFLEYNEKHPLEGRQDHVIFGAHSPFWKWPSEACSSQEGRLEAHRTVSCTNSYGPLQQSKGNVLG